MRAMLMWLMAIAVLGISGCGYNAIQTQDEQVKASWSEVLNQYQRRADLVPNLVNTVKGFANQEKDVLTRVTEARAGVGSVQASPELINDPQAFSKFEAAQAQLTSSLSITCHVPRGAAVLADNRAYCVPHRGQAQVRFCLFADSRWSVCPDV